MLRAAIVGASGYTGGELARLLCIHPSVNITAATSRQNNGKPLAHIFPHLRDRTDLNSRTLAVAENIELAELVL